MSFIKSTLKPFQTILAPTVKTSNVQFYKKPSAGNGLGSAINAPFTRSGAGRKVIDASGNLVDAAANLPAWTFPIGGSAAGCPYLSFLPSVENLLTYSEQFDNAAWTKSNVTISANATTAPDGTTTADKIVGDAVSGSKIAFQPVTVTSSTVYSGSVFFKADEYSLAYVRFGGVSGQPYVVYDLSTQSIDAESGFTSTNIVDYGNGWYRIDVTATASGTTIALNASLAPSSYTIGASNVLEYTGDGTSGGFIWGAQLKEGSYISPLDYIPTTSAAVTRSADDLTDITDLQGDGYLSDLNEGSLIFQVNPTNLTTQGGTQKTFIFEDSTGGDVFGLRATPSSNRLYNELSSDAVVLEEGVLQRLVVTWSDTSLKIYYNGFLEVEYIHSSSIEVARLNNMVSANELGTNVKMLNFAPTALTASEAEAASSWPSAALMISDLGYTLA